MLASRSSILKPLHVFATNLHYKTRKLYSPFLCTSISSCRTLKTVTRVCQANTMSLQEDSADGGFQFAWSVTKPDPAVYDVQLAEKQKIIENKFADLDMPCLEAFRSEPIHYRMRTEFTVWHEADDTYYAMHERLNGEEKPQRIRVDSFPVGSKLINELMPRVMEAVRSSDTLRNKLFQANFHTTLSGESMITLIYHKKLDNQWIEAAKSFRESLSDVPGSTSKPNIIGRARKQRILIDAGNVNETLNVEGRGKLNFTQVEGAFSQPNAGICQSMLKWAVDVTRNSTDHDLLELYCGNGNFTAAVAPNFRRIIATEVSKSAVAAAKENFAANNVQNVLVARMRSEEFVEAWKSGRNYKRLENVDLKSYDFKTLLVDPPRAGLDDETRALVRQFQRIVYISCNPETLHRDINEVKDIFQVEKFAMFDQFPYTHHVECGVYLVRRDGNATGKETNLLGKEPTSAEAELRQGEKRKADAVFPE